MKLASEGILDDQSMQASDAAVIEHLSKADAARLRVSRAASLG